MRLLDESTVQPGEIDGLGHLNVRFYLTRALRGHELLMASLGLDRKTRATAGAVLNRVDTYCRYHREQRLGARLQSYGGWLKTSADSLTAYHEIRGGGETAATFVIEFALEDLETHRRLPLAPGVRRKAESELVVLPDYAQPRSLSLAPPRLDLEMGAIRQGASPGDGSVLDREIEFVIDPSECDAFGFLREGEDMKFGAQRGPVEALGPAKQLTDDGRRFGWVSMETRSVEAARPRVGDLLRSMPVEIGLHRKARHNRRWIFNLTAGRLAGIEDNVVLAFDIEARRAIEIPASAREQLQARHLPELA